MEAKLLSQEEINKMINEIKESDDEELKEFLEEEYVFKLKPVWQFQSVEFEVKGTKKDIPAIMDLYSTVLAKLMEIAPEQNKQVQPAVKMPSDAQKELMRKFGIPFTAQTTAKEAQELIKESVEKANR